ncbi:MAG TPA: ABC transporter substrate-binding protein [Pseudonocardiaceae bacterium]|nr:ABC transporter substrate-binding protein [Pseudonocardiaceae bacterium]
MSPFTQRSVPAALCVLAALVACSAPSTTSAAADELVLADGYEQESLHPLLGYGTEGASRVFDGLVSHDANRQLQPALAVEVPQPSDDSRSWTVRLRDGVRFHDGSSFGAEDVVATYRALLDPATASTEKTTFSMITKVTKVDPRTVRFDLAFPYAAFAHRLTLGVLPSEALAEPGPAEKSSLTTEPIGTGPYRVVQWRKGERLVFEANDSYWGGAPKVRRITVVYAIDDNTRAQRMTAGEFDGTVLPPGLAHTFDSRSGYSVISHRSADYRTIMLPTGNPVTGDPAIRLALNHAANRQGMIDALLSGEGEPAYTPIPPALGDYADPGATFAHDPAQAERILQQAGWTPGPDGIRQRAGRPARFTLMYPADDTVRKDLAQAFASDARQVGVDIHLEGLGWEAIEPRMGADALVLGGGSPADPDLVSYALLHSSFAADGFNNPGSYRNPAVDAALDTARRSLGPAERVKAYREFQQAYIADPAMVFLVFLNHTYVVRDSLQNYRARGYQEVVEPHSHGTGWGPWWNVENWSASP